MNHTELDNATVKELNASGNWAYFIGFYYIFIGVLIVVTGVYFFANKDVAIHLAESAGVSINIKHFLMDANEWLVLLLTLVSACIVFMNAFFLIKFRSSGISFFLTDDTSKLDDTYTHLRNYLRLNSLFSIGSILLSLIAIIYFLID